MGALGAEIGERHAVVLRMFNDRSPAWEVTEDRIDALVAVPSGLEKRHAETIASMIDIAIEGSKSWGMTTERFTALQQYLALVMAPTMQTIRDLIRRTQLGGVRDGVAGREWFIDTMKLLLHLEEGQA